MTSLAKCVFDGLAGFQHRAEHAGLGTNRQCVIVGVEAAGEITRVGPDVTSCRPGDRVVAYGALTCGTCKACRTGRDNLCENVASIMGFHVDGFARELVNMPARLVVPIPDNVSYRNAACAPVSRFPSEICLSSNPTQNPAVICGVNPMNHASVKSCVVPVLPPAGRPTVLALMAVPN